jgi:hypothetical protein
MKRKLTRIFTGCLSIGIVVVLIMSAAGCNSKTSTTTGVTSSAKLTSIAITPETPDNLKVGAIQQFTAIGTYSDGTTADITDQVLWASSDTSVSTVSLTGAATAVAVGTTNISATVLKLTAQSVPLTIIPAPVLSSIAITTAPPHNIGAGSTLQFIATGTYVDGSTADISSSVTWTSTNTDVVHITSTGLATATAVGSVKISAALSGVTSPLFDLPVAAAELSSIAVTPSNPSVLGIGFTAQFTATGTYADGTTANITTQVTWASSDTGIVTISKGGLAAGVANGNANITATLSGVSSDSVAVPVATLTGLTLTPVAPGTIAIGSTLLFRVVGTYSNGVNSLLTIKVTWSSSNTAVATISGDGLVTGVGVGTTDITVSAAGFTAKVVTVTVATTTTTP